MNFLFINDSGEELNEDFLGKWVKAVSEELLKRQILSSEKNALELSVVFLKENDAKQLNWNYRQKDYATDVLSFETDDPASLGELVLCAPVLRRQATEHKQSFDHETGYMVLHGILHLLGYEHEKDEEDAEEMMSLQDEIFALLTKPVVTKKAVGKKPAPVKTKAAATKPKTSSVKKPSSKAAPAKGKSAGKTKTASAKKTKKR
ncbi:MAG: rRNA maturation RNase YbeY [Bdellovibrionaceae bacterium]|nr:rRNA maturation RNase YbeY [Pseudobdellovibrionaceae bacterium]